MNTQKLIIAFLGSGKETPIEQHNLFIGVGESYEDPKIIEEMIKFWPVGSHIDDAVILTDIPGYRIEVIPIPPGIDAQTISQAGNKLFVVWMGFYLTTPKLNIPGLLIIDTEQHALGAIVAKNQEEISEKLMMFPPFAEGQKKERGAKDRSHIDNQHPISTADIDKIININEYLRERGLMILLVEQGKLKDRENIQWHGYAKFSRFLPKERIDELRKKSSSL